ncbi:Hypothetical protein SMAX5B_001375 [Scophthalmus maximus]|uniref:Uncharacterized protein n=1 Tax=Scophthalmus maximus TaxID=52904 RepID=A0A2U9CR59_SCOMX|nr:Hypothetical protein SMAX5B_001375 [Scophthalmus maximus]
MVAGFANFTLLKIESPIAVQGDGQVAGQTAVANLGDGQTAEQTGCGVQGDGPEAGQMSSGAKREDMEAVRMGIAVQTGIPEVGQTGGDDEEGSAGQPTSETRSRGQPKTQTQEHALSQPSSLTQTKRPAGSLSLEQVKKHWTGC